MHCVRALFFLCLLALVASTSAINIPRVVEIAQGAVRGYKQPGDDYFAFNGIPYATSPKGPHKFKAPLPPPTWTNILEATMKDLACPQGPMVLYSNVIVTEDCLVVNVYVPDTDRTNLSVVVYVHGGAYQYGYGDWLTHSTFVNHGSVIEVTFNYRLGAHGFLCLGTEYAPGNAGMKDQLAALRWVKENVFKFGGNNEDITIAGYSAGSASVELLLLSNSTKGLFQKAILESGSSTSVWAVQVDPIANAKKIALSLNYTNVKDISDLEHFYKITSLDIILANPIMNLKDSSFVFVPCVERTNSEDSFLTNPPTNLIKKGNFHNIPILIGFSNMEGLFRIYLFDEWHEKMNSNFSEFLPADLQFNNDEERDEVVKGIKEFYFGGKPVESNTVQGYIDYFTDILFAYPILRTSIFLISRDAPTYLYHYSYVDEAQYTPFNVKGAEHCAQSFIVCDNINATGGLLRVTEDFKNVRRMMIDLWINFITTGNPVVQNSSKFPSGWPAMSSKNLEYMELNLNPELRSNLLQTRRQFWDRIYGQYYYKGPVAPTFTALSK